MRNFFRTSKFSTFLSCISNDFRQNKAGVTAVEYAIVAAGVAGVLILICLGNDSTMAKLIGNIFNEATSAILNNLSRYVSFK